MKSIKWKSLVITCIVCLLPILSGVAVWDKLPQNIAIHFDINNNPDNYAGKGFAVFALPFLMAVFQAFCCIVSDINAKKHGERKMLEWVVKWIIPFVCVILYHATMGYALGWDLDIRRIAVFIVGVILILTGVCLSGLDYVKNYNVSKEKAKKINKFMGFATVIMGVLFLISILFKPVISVICLFLLVPYIIITVIVTLKLGRK